MQFKLTIAILAACLALPSATLAQRDRGDDRYDRQSDERYDQQSDRQFDQESQRDRQSDRRRSDRQQRQADRQRRSGGMSQVSSARQMIDRFDENGDGVLSRGELPRNLRGSFDQLDRDGNNELNAREMTQHAKRMQRRVVPVEVVYVWVNDTDRGRISPDDLQSAYDTLQTIDEDGDGEITRSELQQCRQEISEKWAKTVVKRLDENDNDRISQSEAENSFLSRRFDQIDRNGDGQIARDELQKSLSPTQRDERSARRSDDESTQ